jgi:hypothetical protein
MMLLKFLIINSGPGGKIEYLGNSVFKIRDRA